MNSNSDKLRQSYNELLEFKIVLQKVYFFPGYSLWWAYPRLSLSTEDVFFSCYFGYIKLPVEVELANNDLYDHNLALVFFNIILSAFVLMCSIQFQYSIYF